VTQRNTDDKIDTIDKGESLSQNETILNEKQRRQAQRIPQHQWHALRQKPKGTTWLPHLMGPLPAFLFLCFQHILLLRHDQRSCPK
jgi:hypothetical protein